MQVKKMPKLVYKMMTEKQIKKLLTDLKLSIKGDRKTLEQRHKEYTLRTNCAVFSNKKLDATAIAAEVHKLERQRQRAESSTLHNVASTTLNQRTASNDTSFAQLIQQVKSRQPANKRVEDAAPIASPTVPEISMGPASTTHQPNTDDEAPLTSPLQAASSALHICDATYNEQSLSVTHLAIHPGQEGCQTETMACPTTIIPHTWTQTQTHTPEPRPSPTHPDLSCLYAETLDEEDAIDETPPSEDQYVEPW
jgi:hypothetical protein